MLLDNKKVILIYGFSEEEENNVRNLFIKSKLPNCRAVTKAMTEMKVKDIIDGMKLEVYAHDVLDEKVILFNNLSDEELDRAIKEVRNNIETQPILAVVTPASNEWTFKELLAHLIEERQWFRKHND